MPRKNIRTNAMSISHKWEQQAGRMPKIAQEMVTDLGRLYVRAGQRISERYKSPGKAGLAKLGHPFGRGMRKRVVKRRLKSGKIVRKVYRYSRGKMPYPPQYIGYITREFSMGWGFTTKKSGTREIIAYIYNRKKTARGRSPILPIFTHGSRKMIKRPVDRLIWRNTAAARRSILRKWSRKVAEADYKGRPGGVTFG